MDFPSAGTRLRGTMLPVFAAMVQLARAIGQQVENLWMLSWTAGQCEMAECPVQACTCDGGCGHACVDRESAKWTKGGLINLLRPRDCGSRALQSPTCRTSRSLRLCAGDSSRDLTLLLSIAAGRRVAWSAQQEREEAVRTTENKGQIGGEPLRPGPEKSRRSTTVSATRSSGQ